MARFELNGKTALATGAAGGIGAALARQLACAGCNLALADIDEDRLARTSDAIQNAAPEIKTSSHFVDMGKPETTAELVHEVISVHGQLSVLINNAGVALGGRFRDVEPADFDWLMRVNFSGPVYLAREALKHIEQSSDGAIVNISSIFGIVAPPGHSAYCASKFAIRGFSEALRHELEDSSTHVLVVHPGGVNTNIANAAKISSNANAAMIEKDRERLQKALKLTPEKAAAEILQALKKKRRRVLVGKDAKFLDLVQRVWPSGYNTALHHMF